MGHARASRYESDAMTISLLYGCCQIETSAPDLAATRRFMIDRLGAGPVEQPLAREIARIIPDPAYDVDHLECGEAVFQINQPSPTMMYNGHKSIHQSYLDKVGPCVTNLNFFVDDHVHAHALLTGLGAQTHIRGPSSAARALADYGPENSRPGADERPFLFMGSRHLIGFDLEIMEPNFLRFSEQETQFPAFVQPRPKTGDGNLRLRRLVVAVEGLEATYDCLEKLFAPASRSRPYAYREGTLGKSFRMTLGGMEIEYCQPWSREGMLADDLQRFGQGVVAIEFGARNIAGAFDKIVGSATIEDGFDLLGTGADGAHRIACRAETGFDVVVSPLLDGRF